MTAKEHRVEDPFNNALKAKGWPRDEWKHIRQDHELRQGQR
jgi:hypothetical protein